MNIVRVTHQGGGYLGFRPEAASIHPANKTSGDAEGMRFVGRVAAIDYMGSDYFIAVQLDETVRGEEGDSVVRIRTQHLGKVAIQHGDKVVVAVAADDLCWFDSHGNAVAAK
ncbi:MAG: TOBE domain-containing protein [Proteobacteria bacterium]|nr:TOBE domain-containing protein [Pseudomonadota bacterium]